MTISGGRKIFLNGEIVLCGVLGAVALAVGGFSACCGCLCCRVSFAVCGRFCGFIRGNKKAVARLGFRFGCVARSILRQYPQKKY